MLNHGKKVLLVGESCIVHTYETKGYDQFLNIRYNEFARLFAPLLEASGHQVTHLPAHLVPTAFPNTLESLMAYDVVLISDVGANTFLLHPDTMRFGKRTPNLLKLIRSYVAAGGGFGMIGGYMTFMGIDGKARYKDTPVEEVLPVTLMERDDRVEAPEGADIIIDPQSHALLQGIPEAWPYILGYNRVFAKPEAQVLVSYENDPILTIGTYEKGRTMAWATDCSPHWLPVAFYDWEPYGKLWDRIIGYLAKDSNIV